MAAFFVIGSFAVKKGACFLGIFEKHIGFGSIKSLVSVYFKAAAPGFQVIYSSTIRLNQAHQNFFAAFFSYFILGQPEGNFYLVYLLGTEFLVIVFLLFSAFVQYRNTDLVGIKARSYGHFLRQISDPTAL